MARKPVDLSHHGSTYGYRRGCRCDPCKQAKSEDWKRYRARQQFQINPFEDFEGQNGTADQVADLLREMTLRVRCDCGVWHEDQSLDFQCPNGALQPDFPDPEVQ